MHPHGPERSGPHPGASRQGIGRQDAVRFPLAAFRKLRLDQLSTFGLLAHLRQAEATSLLNALIKADLVEQTENQRNRPIVKLTSRGEKVMKGHLRLDPTGPAGGSAANEIAEHPVGPDGGPSRTDCASRRRCSAAIEQLTSSPPRPTDQRDGVHAVRRTHPDYFWTWRVVSAGCTPAECAQIRRLDQAEVCGTSPASCRSRILEVRAADVFTPHEISQLLHLAAAGDHAAHGRAEPHAAPVTADQLAVFQSCQDRDSQFGFGSDCFVGRACLT